MARLPFERLNRVETAGAVTTHTSTFTTAYHYRFSAPAIGFVFAGCQPPQQNTCYIRLDSFFSRTQAFTTNSNRIRLPSVMRPTSYYLRLSNTSSSINAVVEGIVKFQAGSSAIRQISQNSQWYLREFRTTSCSDVAPWRRRDACSLKRGDLGRSWSRGPERIGAHSLGRVGNLL